MTTAPFLHQVLLRRRVPTSNHWRGLLIAQSELLETSYCKVRELGHTHIAIFNPISATKQWLLNVTTLSLYPEFPVTLNTLMWRDRRKIIVRHRIFHGVCSFFLHGRWQNLVSSDIWRNAKVYVALKVSSSALSSSCLSVLNGYAWTIYSPMISTPSLVKALPCVQNKKKWKSIALKVLSHSMVW